MKQFLLLLIFLLLACVACNHQGAGPVVTETVTLASDQARVTTYLETQGGSKLDIRFRLVGVELAASGLWHPLFSEKIKINLEQVMGRQHLLGIGALQAGTYTRLRLTFTEVERNGEKLLAEGEERKLELPLATPLVLAPSASSCFFIKWHLASPSLVGGDFFATFSARPQSRHQVADLVTVLCRDLDTVYQVSPDQNRVVAALGLPTKIGEIAFDWHRRRFYAVGTDDRLLLQYDAVTNRLLDTIALPLAVAPSDLVISDDGRYAYLSDTLANRIIKVDLVGGFVERETTSHLRPGRLFFLAGPQRDIIAVLAPSEAAVYLLDAGSLNPLFILPVNGRPAGLAISRDYLYVSDNSSDKVAAYSLENGRLIALIRVGRAPLDLVAGNGRVYVSVSGESYLSLLMPPQVIPVRRIACRFKPQDLVISNNWQKIYIANHLPCQLEVLDLQTGRSLSTIPLAGRPDQVVLWEPPQ